MAGNVFPPGFVGVAGVAGDGGVAAVVDGGDTVGRLVGNSGSALVPQPGQTAAPSVVLLQAAAVVAARTTHTAVVPARRTLDVRNWTPAIGLTRPGYAASGQSDWSDSRCRSALRE